MHIIHGSCHLLSELHDVWSVTITAACLICRVTIRLNRLHQSYGQTEPVTPELWSDWTGYTRVRLNRLHQSYGHTEPVTPELQSAWTSYTRVMARLNRFTRVTARLNRLHQSYGQTEPVTPELRPDRTGYTRVMVRLNRLHQSYGQTGPVTPEMQIILIPYTLGCCHTKPKMMRPTMGSCRLTIILFPSHCAPSFQTLKYFVKAMGDVV